MVFLILLIYSDIDDKNTGEDKLYLYISPLYTEGYLAVLGMNASRTHGEIVLL